MTYLWNCPGEKSLPGPSSTHVFPRHGGSRELHHPLIPQTLYSPTDKNPYEIHVHESCSLLCNYWLNFRLKILKALRSKSFRMPLSLNSWIWSESAIIVKRRLLASTQAAGAHAPNHPTQTPHSCLTSPLILWITLIKPIYLKRTKSYQFLLIQCFLQNIRCFEKCHAHTPSK